MRKAVFINSHAYVYVNEPEIQDYISSQLDTKWITFNTIKKGVIPESVEDLMIEEGAADAYGVGIACAEIMFLERVNNFSIVNPFYAILITEEALNDWGKVIHRYFSDVVHIDIPFALYKKVANRICEGEMHKFFNGSEEEYDMSRKYCNTIIDKLHELKTGTFDHLEHRITNAGNRTKH